MVSLRASRLPAETIFRKHFKQLTQLTANNRFYYFGDVRRMSPIVPWDDRAAGKPISRRKVGAPGSRALGSPPVSVSRGSGVYGGRRLGVT